MTGMRRALRPTVSVVGALALAVVLVAVPRAHGGAASDRELIGQLDREVIALKQRVRHMESQLATCGEGSGDPGTVYPELVQIFAEGPVTVERKGAHVLVTLPVDLVFSQNALTLRQEGEFALDLLATALKLHPDTRVMVVGHTDAEPVPAPLRRAFPTNWELSTARAGAVAGTLVQRFGLDPARLTVAGRADTQPLTAGDTPEGRATNQRIVVHIQPGGTP